MVVCSLPYLQAPNRVTERCGDAGGWGVDPSGGSKHMVPLGVDMGGILTTEKWVNFRKNDAKKLKRLLMGLSLIFRASMGDNKPSFVSTRK